MATTAKDTAQDLVTIEVDGRELTARRGQMLIEVTDAADIYIPRFCYHPELSVAANCRMCLVEVERAPKPLPACATPVADGMKVRTRSALALDAQRATMEFLLINHPLDCPICDQGGECELQDLAMGFGNDVSRYSERKRVVPDPDIGPLIQTDLTRCIHCTRCVRFGEEVAGMKELGATGRGEHMTIGTYVGRAVTSELSGNVIDLCPVGALTSKPFRFSARPWELRARPALAPHDCVGSACEVHVKGDTVKRVVPRENPEVNLTWLSDRDRFSYQGLYAADRLLEPMIKEQGEWRPAEWEEALDLAADALRRVVDEEGPEALGVLASPSATLEELYALALLARGLGCENIDHRLQQADFRAQDHAPMAPVLGQSWTDLEQADAVLLVGSWTRSEQPLANLRLRRAALAGARIAVVNPAAFAWNWAPALERVVRPSAMPRELAAIAAALGVDAATGLVGGAPDEAHRRIAEMLSAAERPAVLLGALATAHPEYSALAGLARAIAAASGARMGTLTSGANAVGAWLAGAVPHRGAGGAPRPHPGLDADAMFRSPRQGYLLFGVEPLYDCLDGARAQRALEAADVVVAFSGFRSPELDAAADVLLPMALFAENEGTLINAEGRWQSFGPGVRPPGDVRRAWRVLRVLGNRLDVEGFEWFECEELRTELAAQVESARPDDGAGAWPLPQELAGAGQGMERLTVLPMNRVDALVRRAPALQRTVHTPDCRVHLAPADAARIGVADAEPVVLTQGDQRVELPVALDERVPEGVVLLWGGEPTVAAFGQAGGPIDVGRPA